MIKYSSYNDSGIEWLGNKPTHWSNYRIDWITAFVRGNTGLKKDELLEIGDYVALQYGKTYKVDEVDNSFNFFVNSEYYKRNQTVKRGDTILISTSETIEDLGHSCFYNRDDIGLLGGEQILLKPKTKLINEKYLYYFSKIFCGELRKYATGLKVFRFNTDDLKKVFIAIPPTEVQTAIAQYLDTKTQAIDKKIYLLTKKANYYKELRKSIINDAVCKGLDKNVKLKESGIEWIGEIPEHWEVKRLKDIAKVQTGNTPPMSEKENYSDIGLPWVKPNELYDLTPTFTTTDFISDIGKEQVRIVKEGAVMVCCIGSIGKMGVAGLDLCTNQQINSISFYKINPVFGKFLIFISKDEHIRHSTGNVVAILNCENQKRIEFAIPPKEEQTAIAKYLDEKTQKVDAIVSNIGKQIDTLKELRKTLINDVVTGKIKVIA